MDSLSLYEISCFAAGFAGNLFAFALFLSPVPTFKRILKAKSTEQFDGLPYLLSLLNCFICLWYGLPWVSDGRLLVATVNGTGAAFQLAYISLFFIYADSRKTRDVILFTPGDFPDSSTPDFIDGSPALPREDKTESTGAHISNDHAESSTKSIPVGGEFSMSVFHGDIPVSIPTGIAEGFVSPTIPTSSVSPSTENDASKALIEPSNSLNTLDKKNRKKRAAKTTSPDTRVPKLRISADVDAFYTKFLRAKYFKPDNSPIFVSI